MDIFEIGTEIRKQRQQQGMRQVDLAAKARISRSILVALETGKLPELGFGKICALLAALGHTLEDLRNDQNLE